MLPTQRKCLKWAKNGFYVELLHNVYDRYIELYGNIRYLKNWGEDLLIRGQVLLPNGQV
jgi:hypothetical protein